MQQEAEFSIRDELNKLRTNIRKIRSCRGFSADPKSADELNFPAFSYRKEVVGSLNRASSFWLFVIEDLLKKNEPEIRQFLGNPMSVFETFSRQLNQMHPFTNDFITMPDVIGSIHKSGYTLGFDARNKEDDKESKTLIDILYALAKLVQK